MPVKQELRQKLRHVLDQIPADELATRSLRAAHRLFEQPEYVKAETIMVFLSLPSEIDTSPVVLRAWQDGKRVLAPKVSWTQRRMLPLEIRSLTDDLAVAPGLNPASSDTSTMGLREPISGIPFPIPLIDLVIVPGIGFDEYGNRLGRGRGFYDKFLSHSEFAGTACGLALEDQMVPSLPVGPLDRPIDMLATDVRIRRFERSNSL